MSLFPYLLYQTFWLAEKAETIRLPCDLPRFAIVTKTDICGRSNVTSKKWYKCSWKTLEFSQTTYWTHCSCVVGRSISSRKATGTSRMDISGDLFYTTTVFCDAKCIDRMFKCDYELQTTKSPHPCLSWIVNKTSQFSPSAPKNPTSSKEAWSNDTCHFGKLYDQVLQDSCLIHA